MSGRESSLETDTARPRYELLRFMGAAYVIFLPWALLLCVSKAPVTTVAFPGARSALLFASEVHLSLAPVLAFPTLCMALMVASPYRYARMPVIRFGLYTGCIVFAAVQVLAVFSIGGCDSLYVEGGSFPLPALAALVFAPLAGACHVAMARVALKVAKPGRPKWWAWGVSWIAWGSMCAWAVKMTAVRAMEAYSKLPSPQPEDCYVTTAAARGHAWLVGSRPVVCADGRVTATNAQMCRFKYVELCIANRLPRLHRFLRRIYDTIGPPMARALVHPLLADLAYLLLKPVEWVAWLGLLLVVALDRTREAAHE